MLYSDCITPKGRMEEPKTRNVFFLYINNTIPPCNSLLSLFSRSPPYVVHLVPNKGQRSQRDLAKSKGQTGALLRAR